MAFHAIAAAASLAAAASAPPPGGYPPWTAVRLWPNATEVVDATCLDGSPPLYYISPGWGDGASKWQIHHEGGAWCGGADDCYGWWGFRSTLVDPDVMPSDQNANMGYFNRTEPQNSMSNWNYVFIRYCDGWSFASNRAQPTVLPVTNSSGSFNVTMHFRGLAVLDAVRRDLIKKGMGAATDVVVGGCSAGGLAVFLHCDEWADALHAVAPAMNVVCLSDSGWCVQRTRAAGGAAAALAALARPFCELACTFAPARSPDSPRRPATSHQVSPRAGRRLPKHMV
jgi:hypothetical protein